MPVNSSQALKILPANVIKPEVALSPTALVEDLISAVKPFIDKRDLYKLKPGYDIANVYRAIVHHFSAYTIADAVLMIVLLRSALEIMPGETADRKECPDREALYKVRDLLEDFASIAESTSSACASARARLLCAHSEEDILADDNVTAIISSIATDMDCLRLNRYRGETFGAKKPGELPRWLERAMERRT